MTIDELLDEYKRAALKREGQELEAPCAGCGNTPQTCTCDPDPLNLLGGNDGRAE